jgi:hypothetical protein
MVSGLAAELLMAAVVIFGVGRVRERRERRRWRGVALGGLHALHMTWDMAELVAFQVELYTGRKYGGAIPEHLTYYDVLIEALGEPETWEAVPEEAVPPLLEQVEEVHDDLERLFPQWAPVLIHDEDLARIASRMPDLIFASRRLIGQLRAAEESAVKGKTRRDWITPRGYDQAAALVEEFRDYDRQANALGATYIGYRDNVPPPSWPSLDDDYPPGTKVLSDPDDES